MARTVKCPKCKMDIPRGASKCPYCHSKIGISAGGCLTAFIVFMIIVGAIVAINNARNKQQDKDAAISSAKAVASSAAEADLTSTTVLVAPAGNTFAHNGFEITEAGEYLDQDNNYWLEGTITNKTEQDAALVTIKYTIVSDSGKYTDTAMDAVSVPSGETVKFSVWCPFPEEPVRFEFKDIEIVN